jgi:hypothetical protein
MLWIGGAQWAGKTSVAQRLARERCLQLYLYDYHDSRGHSWRARVYPERYPLLNAALARSADQNWVESTPGVMAQRALGIFDERFQMVLEDLTPFPAELGFLVEGWGIRPHHLEPLLPDRRRAIFLVPSDAFRRRQMDTLERARSSHHLGVTHEKRAHRNRLERDLLITANLVQEAERHRFRMLTVDGRLSLDHVVELVERHFSPYLPALS